MQKIKTEAGVPAAILKQQWGSRAHQERNGSF
jgi:hypothetical protein